MGGLKDWCTLHHGCRFSSYVVLWCAGGREGIQPVRGCLGRASLFRSRLPGEACLRVPPPLRPSGARLPDTRAGR